MSSRKLHSLKEQCTKRKSGISTEKKIDHIHTSSTVFPVISDGNFGAGDTAVLIVEVVLHDNQNKRIR